MFNKMTQCTELKEFFATPRINHYRDGLYFPLFVEAYSKYATISEDVLYAQSKTSCELMTLMNDVWNKLMPQEPIIGSDGKPTPITRPKDGWVPFSEVFKGDKGFRLLQDAYVNTNTERVIRYKNAHAYDYTNEAMFNSLIDVFVGNFSFQCPQQTAQFLRSWFKIAKRGFCTDDENRSCALIIVGPNYGGKSRIVECISKAFCEMMGVESQNKTIDNFLGQFGHLPKTHGIINLNECFVPSSVKSSSKLKDILGNERQSIEYKGLNQRATTLNHNVFIGSANDFVHLSGMEDTRFLNLRIGGLKYSSVGVGHYKDEIIRVVKDIIKFCPECTSSEFDLIRRDLSQWNNTKGDNTEWRKSLYEACEGSFDKLRALVTSANAKSKGAIAKVLADVVNKFEGECMTPSKYNALMYKIKKDESIFDERNHRHNLKPEIFDAVYVDETEVLTDAWSNSPVHLYCADGTLTPLPKESAQEVKHSEPEHVEGANEPSVGLTAEDVFRI